jgi:hypothetical protein
MNDDTSFKLTVMFPNVKIITSSAALDCRLIVIFGSYSAYSFSEAPYSKSLSMYSYFN